MIGANRLLKNSIKDCSSSMRAVFVAHMQYCEYSAVLFVF
ncbi:hypothetical protein HMPREF9162_0539 [Selenomonas sp. oral taxon 137 str. F0430]|nr:hypothetical protein HMPREF9162_0539 [Selenomonas sp. oral taxon 137 str. F0430]